MAKTKTWETKTRIYTRYRGKTTYSRKGANGRVSTLPIQQDEFVDFTERPEDVIRRLDAKIRTQAIQLIDLPNDWPTTTEVEELMTRVKVRAHFIYNNSKKDETKFSIDKALFYLKQVERHLYAALIP